MSTTAICTIRLEEATARFETSKRIAEKSYESTRFSGVVSAGMDVIFADMALRDTAAPTRSSYVPFSHKEKVENWTSWVVKAIAEANSSTVPLPDLLLGLRYHLESLYKLFPERPSIETWVLAGEICKIIDKPENMEAIKDL